MAEERYFFTITLTKEKVEQAMRIAPDPTDEAVLALFTTAVEVGLDILERQVKGFLPKPLAKERMA